jgi:ABC-2 type transport system ATP-binding protein
LYNKIKAVRGKDNLVIQVENLTKLYDEEVAVDNISFSVKKGEIFCIAGPNGSGKTSTIECVEGLRPIDSGTIRVLGLDPFKERQKLYEQIGVQIQEHVFVSEARVDELCRLYSSFYKNPEPYEALLEEFDLYDSRKIHAVNLSGGQKKKLSFILALLPKPKIVFLDEITSFLDPASRKDMLSYIRNLKTKGITTIHITHHMDEAQALSDRICFMKDGKIIDIDTVPNMIEKSNLPETITFESVDKKLDLSKLKAVKGIEYAEIEADKVTIKGRSDNLLRSVMDYLRTDDIEYNSFYDRPPNLEDVYLDIMGYGLEENKGVK